MNMNFDREANPQDPESVRVARYKEINQIIKWIQDAQRKN